MITPYRFILSLFLISLLIFPLFSIPTVHGQTTLISISPNVGRALRGQPDASGVLCPSSTYQFFSNASNGNWNSFHGDSDDVQRCQTTLHSFDTVNIPDDADIVFITLEFTSVSTCTNESDFEIVEVQNGLDFVTDTAETLYQAVNSTSLSVYYQDDGGGGSNDVCGEGNSINLCNSPSVVSCVDLENSLTVDEFVLGWKINSNSRIGAGAKQVQIVCPCSLDVTYQGGTSDFGEGENPTHLVVALEDSQGNSKSDFGIGELVIIKALLLNVTGNAVPLVNFELVLHRNGANSSQITDSNGRANFTRVPSGIVGESIVYTLEFQGSVSQNLSSVTRLIQVNLVGTGGIGSISTSLVRPLFFRIPNDGSTVNTIIHGENLVVGTRITAEDGSQLAGKTIFFYFDKNNTGTFQRFQLTCQSDNTGQCLTRPFSFGTTWTGISRVFASFEGDSVYLGTNSSIDNFILASSVLDFELSIEVDPNQLLSQERFEVKVRLVTSTNGIETPITNEFVRVWWATDTGNFIRIINSNVDNNGFLIRGFNAPSQIGIYNLKANATINSVVVQTSNVTLTVLVDLLQIPGVELPDGGQPQLGDLLQTLPDFGFGGIVLWVVTFLMFTIAINVAFAKIFSIGNIDMPQMLPIMLTTLIFGMSVVIGSAFGWITLQQIVIIVAPVALISGILISSRLRSNGSNG